MKNRTVFILVALITVVAGSLFVSTSDVEAATVKEETIECPAGVEVSLTIQLPTGSLKLQGDHPADTTLVYNAQGTWTLTFTPVEVRTYTFSAADLNGNACLIKIVSTEGGFCECSRQCTFYLQSE
jgi:hypothetical protein